MAARLITSQQSGYPVDLVVAMMPLNGVFMLRSSVKRSLYLPEDFDVALRYMIMHENPAVFHRGIIPRLVGIVHEWAERARTEPIDSSSPYPHAALVAEQALGQHLKGHNNPQLRQAYEHYYPPVRVPEPA